MDANAQQIIDEHATDMRGITNARREPNEQHKRSDRVRAWIMFAGTSAIFAASVLWHPQDEGGVVLCPFRATTGLPCPGCGLTRAFCAIVRGELERALHFNIISPIVFLATIIVWLYAVSVLLKIDPLRDLLARLRPGARVWQATFALLIIWWAVRLSLGI